MLTQVQCLSEIGTQIPNNQRRFHVENELMGIDPSKVVVARTFTGNLLLPVDGKGLETEVEQKLIELYYEGGVYTTTVLTDELKGLLFKETKEVSTKGTAKPKGDSPKPFQPYKEPMRLPEYKRTDINTWN